MDSLNNAVVKPIESFIHLSGELFFIHFVSYAFIYLIYQFRLSGNLRKGKLIDQPLRLG
jgi:hypothetical protein